MISGLLETFKESIVECFIRSLHGCIKLTDNSKSNPSVSVIHLRNCRADLD